MTPASVHKSLHLKKQVNNSFTVTIDSIFSIIMQLLVGQGRGL